jgi:hypothetical protein
MFVRRLDVPQRAQPQRIDAEETGVSDAREERGRALRERTERGARSSIASIGVSRIPRTMPRKTASTSCESLPERESGMRSAFASSRSRPMVLISPLCANTGKGWTRSKLVLVFVA